MPEEVESRKAKFQMVPIEKADLFQTVMQRLTTYITESGLKEGDRLPSERQLSDSLGVSRVLIREVLRALAAMGRIDMRKNVGSFVLDPLQDVNLVNFRKRFGDSITFLNELVEVRVAIEQRVVELAGVDPTVDLFAVRRHLEKIGREIEAGASRDKPQGSLDPSFEALLAHEVGNQVLCEFQKSIHRLWIEACIDCGLAAGDRRRLHQEHLRVLEALERGDTEGAVKHIRDHFNGVTDAWDSPDFAGSGSGQNK